jgi:hypothetical protein
MFHCRKQDWMGCAIATAAMVGNQSYEEVVAAFPHTDPADLRWPQSMRRLLEAVTQTKWQRKWLWWQRPVRDWSFPAWPVAAFISDRPWRPRVGQWVAVLGERIHDPEFRTGSLIKQYPRRDWSVTWLLQPARPADLKRNRLGERLAALLKGGSAELDGRQQPGPWSRW